MAKLRYSIFSLLALLLLADAIVFSQDAARTAPLAVQPKLRSATASPSVCRADGSIDGLLLKTANVSVLERRSGLAITALAKDDFTILENGREREIGRVALNRGPLSVSLVVDTSPSRTAQLSQVARAADTIIAGLAPTDRFSLITFDGVINRPVTAKQVAGLSGRDIQIARTTYGTRLYDAVDAALRADFGADGGRKLVVIFTDGQENSSQLAGSDTTKALARESDITIYSVQYPYGGVSKPNHYLQTLSDLTGGKLFMSGIEDSAKRIASILNDVAGRYTICYWSPEPTAQSVAVRLRSSEVAYAIKLHKQ